MMKKPSLITRQKILAGYLHLIGKKVSETLRFKHLFLLAQEFALSRNYDFVPYKFGAYSFTLKNDLSVLERKGIWNKQKANNKLLQEYFFDLDQEDQSQLIYFFETYKDKLNSSHKILEYVYTQYPYFAINSEIINKFPRAKSKARAVRKQIVQQDEIKLFTIGYESKTPEEFLNQLLENNIKCLVDVRCNRHSMKYGFSDSSLRRFCSVLDIKYVPFSELGIVSSKRKNLQEEGDYKRLFKEYENGMPAKKEYIKKLQELLLEHRRIALMCFEFEHHMCHRSVVAKYVLQNVDFPLEKL